MKEFTLRSYGRTELALLYNLEMSPEGAYRRLRKWISVYPNLENELMRRGKRPQARVYTPAQVQAIVDALGEP